MNEPEKTGSQAFRQMTYARGAAHSPVEMIPVTAQLILPRLTSFQASQITGVDHYHERRLCAGLRQLPGDLYGD